MMGACSNSSPLPLLFCFAIRRRCRFYFERHPSNSEAIIHTNLIQINENSSFLLSRHPKANWYTPFWGSGGECKRALFLTGFRERHVFAHTSEFLCPRGAWSASARSRRRRCVALRAADAGPLLILKINKISPRVKTVLKTQTMRRFISVALFHSPTSINIWPKTGSYISCTPEYYYSICYLTMCSAYTNHIIRRHILTE